MRAGPIVSIAFAWLALFSVLEVARAEAEPASVTRLEGLGLVAGNRILRFPLERPGDVVGVAVSGLSGDLLGIDVRPKDGRVYGITDTQDLFVIDLETGDARRTSSLTLGYEGSAHGGFDFNPQADRLRLLAETGQNLRVHVGLGAVAVDGPLAYTAGDANAGERPRVSAVAYTDNVPDAPVTRTFDIDWNLDVLALQEPPNEGELQTVGPLGVDFAALAGFDIHTETDGRERAYASSGPDLYRIALDTGAATALGPIGDGNVPLIGLAVRPLP